MKAVTYCVSDEEKAGLDEYARIKGLKSAGDLARFAVARYMAQFPIGARERANASLRGTPEWLETHSDTGREGGKEG